MTTRGAAPEVLLVEDDPDGEEALGSYIVKPMDFEKFLEIARHIGVYWLMVNEPPLFG